MLLTADWPYLIVKVDSYYF